MKRLAFYFLLLGICFAGCKQKTGDIQEKMKISNDTTLLIDRVGMMYNEYFSYYNRSDFNTNDVEKKFFSEKLKALLETLPTDEMVINANPWICMEEPDSVVYQGGEVRRLDKETAEVLVTIKGFERPYDGRINQRTVMLVREGDDWVIDDFRDKDRNPYSSLLHMIQDYNREHEARQRIEDIYNEICVRYNKGEDFDENKFISTELKNLWEKLPWKKLRKDERGYHYYNVWTGNQRFDSLLLPSVYLESSRNRNDRCDDQRKDTVIVTITINPVVSSNPNKTWTYVKAVYEKGDWYIDDIVHSYNGKELSIQEVARKRAEGQMKKMSCHSEQCSE